MKKINHTYRDGIGDPRDNINDGGEYDVALDHGLKDGLDADLDQLASRGREVDISEL